MDFSINFDSFDYYERIIDRNFLEIDIQLDNIRKTIDNSSGFKKVVKKKIIKKKNVEGESINIKSIEIKENRRIKEHSKKTKESKRNKKFNYGMRFYVVDTSSSEDSEYESD